jgi:hypothetical protein
MTVKTEKPRTPAKKVIARTARAAGQPGADPNAWLVPASAEDDPAGANAKYGPLPKDRRGFSILSASGRSSDAKTAGQALSPGAVWPQELDLVIQNPRTGAAVVAHPVDIGAGSDSILPVIGLYPQTRKDLGLTGGAFKVVIARVDGGGMRPARGTRVTAGFSITKEGITAPEPYEFARGDVGQPENSYDCSGRLAEEVSWSRWVQQNTLFFASDEELRAGSPALTIRGDETWLLKDPAWEWSPNRATNTVTLSVLSNRWGVQIGGVVLINTGRPIDGRYLVSETHGTWVNPELQVVLERPAPMKLEPAPETGTVDEPGSATSNVTTSTSSLSWAQLNQAGIVNWNGHGSYQQAPVAMCAWIANELNWAIDNGWRPSYPVTSGYRPGTDPNTATGTSLHQGTAYPSGAIDFGSYVSPAGKASKLALIALADRLGYPGPRLKPPAGFADDGHCSATGH